MQAPAECTVWSDKDFVGRLLCCIVYYSTIYLSYKMLFNTGTAASIRSGQTNAAAAAAVLLLCYSTEEHKHRGFG